MTKKKEIFYFLENPDGITITIMRDSISACFKTYEMIVLALGSARKLKLPLPHSHLKPAEITDNAATVKEDKEPRGRGRQ